MKHLLTILVFLPLVALGQFTDAFTDGDFSNNPTWQGEEANFEVDANDALRLNAPAVTDKSFLYTSSIAIDTASWQCYVRMEFNPSASNKARIYLVSDQPNLEAALNGYFIQLGNTEDEVSLYRQSGTSTTKIIDGEDGILNEAVVEVLVRATRDTDGNWELFADTSLTANYISQGVVQDTTHQTSAYFGVLCDYTSTRSDKFYFDDFVVTGNAYLDLNPPVISSVIATNANSLQLTFNEALDQSSAETVGNYSVNNGIGSPSIAVLIQPTVVDLTFGSAFPVGTELTLTTNQVSDVSGNPIVNSSNVFIYFEFGSPAFKDIIINEFMADPTPPMGLPELEYVELYNVSSSYFNVSDLVFSDAASSGSVTTFEVLAPGEYVILCAAANTAAFAPFGRTIALTSLPALNNSGDEISISIDSVIIDQLSYDLSWYNDPIKDDGGYSLELINPTNPCSGKNNWTASTSAQGGTPGQLNSVFNNDPDITSPTAERIEILSLTELEVVFDEVMDSASLALGNYTINNSIAIQSVQLDAYFERVILNLTPALDSSVAYTLTISGQSDCSGNSIEATSFEFGIGSSPKPYDLIINEIYPVPSETSSMPNAEYVEIYNRSDKLISTAGLRFADATSSSALFTRSILPEEYVIVCDDAYEALFSAFGKVIPCATLPSLNNRGDQLSLTFEGIEIDAVSYSESWYEDEKKADGGWSLERISPNDLCGTASNWTESEASIGGSPGAENSIFKDLSMPTITIESAQFTSLNSIELNFSGRLDSLFNPAARLNGDLLSMTFSASGDGSVVLSENQFKDGQLYFIEIDSLLNCAGFASYDLSVELYLHDSGDVVINEVLSNPRGSGSDFVELFNSAQYAINLNGWSLAYFDSRDSLRFNLIPSKTLGTQGYVALCEDANNILVNYPFAVEDNLHLTDLPSYPNSEGSVILYDPLSRQMDRLDYTEELHFALLDDLDGVSLERLSPSRPSSDAGNWHSASSTENYATPGYRNSQDYQTSNQAAGVTLSGEFISPDNDGYQDVVNINYNFPSAGYSMTVRVFNDRGVEIKTVASNQLIGADGSFTWDGTNDNGEKAATGIHIILVEAFNLKNEKLRFRLPVVVASRLK